MSIRFAFKILSSRLSGGGGGGACKGQIWCSHTDG